MDELVASFGREFGEGESGMGIWEVATTSRKSIIGELIFILLLDERFREARDVETRYFDEYRESSETGESVAPFRYNFQK